MATQTTKAAPKPAAKKTEAAPKPDITLDFGSLTVQDVAADEVKHTRSSQLDKSPVVDWLRESYREDKGKAVPVPSQAHADALVGLLRAAAARLKIGVKILVVNGDGDSKVVKFLGKEKRKYNPKDDKATA